MNQAARVWARFLGRAVLDNFGRAVIPVTIPSGPKYCQGGQPRAERYEQVTVNPEAPRRTSGRSTLQVGGRDHPGTDTETETGTGDTDR